jgi:hypothetical protein
MRDRWYDSPGYALAGVIALIWILWWGHEQEAARIGNVLWVGAMLAIVWIGRDRTLARRIEALSQAVENLTAVIQARASTLDGEPPATSK